VQRGRCVGSNDTSSKKRPGSSKIVRRAAGSASRMVRKSRLSGLFQDSVKVQQGRAMDEVSDKPKQRHKWIRTIDVL
jgi:hypothetical protein